MATGSHSRKSRKPVGYNYDTVALLGEVTAIDTDRSTASPLPAYVFLRHRQFVHPSKPGVVTIA